MSGFDLAGLLNGRPLYGSLGGPLAMTWTPSGNGGLLGPNSLPDYYRNQYSGGNAGDGDSPFYQLQNNSLLDRQGRSVVQVGDNQGDENLIDPSKAWYDPELGLVSESNNFRHVDRITPGEIAMFAAYPFVAGAGLGAMGVGAGSGAAAAGEGVSAGTLANFATPEIGSLDMATLDHAMSGLGFGTGAGVSAGTLSNFATPPVGSLDTATLDHAMSGLDLGGVPVTDRSTTLGGAPVTDRSVSAGLMDSLRNGVIPGLGQIPSSLTGLTGLLRLAGLGTSLYGLLGGHQNGPGGGNGNGPGSGPGSGPGLSGGLLERQFYTNPVTQSQLQNMQFARPRGLLGR